MTSPTPEDRTDGEHREGSSGNAQPAAQYPGPWGGYPAGPYQPSYQQPSYQQGQQGPYQPGAWGGPYQPGPYGYAPGAPQPAPWGPPYPGRGVWRGAVLGPYSLRELFVLAGGLCLLVALFLPFVSGRPGAATGLQNLLEPSPGQVVSLSLWHGVFTLFLVLGFLLPLVASALTAARKLLPSVGWRVGSLSVDQFASVAAVLALFLSVTELVAVAAVNSLARGWITVVAGPAMVLQLIGAAVIVVGTTLAAVIPPLAVDFLTRPDTPAAPQARRLVAPRPARAGDAPAEGERATEPIAEETSAGVESAGEPASEPSPAPEPESVVAEPAPAEEAAPGPVAHGEPAPAVPEPEPDDRTAVFAAVPDAAATVQPFWFAVPETREALDQATGRPAFQIVPGSWYLALDDRGSEFLVQDDSGTVGVLRDVHDVQRATS